MRLRMQQGSGPEKLSFGRWRTAIMGDAVDERGAAAKLFTESNADLHSVVQYDPATFTMTSNESIYTNENAMDYLSSFGVGTILLEATTLGFVEIFWLCRAAKELGIASIDLLYVEPESYTKMPPGHTLQSRDFALSTEVEGFTAVPGATIIVDAERPPKAVFLLGYEGQRLEQAFEYTELMPSRCRAVMGVPAFKPGWEMDTFANNVKILREKRVSNEIYFGGAQNPLAAYEALDSILSSCSKDDRLLVVPIGTKPHGIGAALFACEHERVGLMYDNPKRKAKRTGRTGMWHLFRAEF